MNKFIKNRLAIAIALGFMASSAHASFENLAVDNSTYDTAQDIGSLSASSLIDVFGFRGSIYSGLLVDDDKADFYSFTLTSAAALKLNVFTDGSDPILGLYDASGAQLAYDDDGGSDYDSFLQYNILSAGTYIAAVNGYNEDESFIGDAGADETNFMYKLQVETAAPIPLPLTVWTFGAGLFGMLAVSSKRRKID